VKLTNSTERNLLIVVLSDQKMLNLLCHIGKEHLVFKQCAISQLIRHGKTLNVNLPLSDKKDVMKKISKLKCTLNLKIYLQQKK
jgi:hypothetical protein